MDEHEFSIPEIETLQEFNDFVGKPGIHAVKFYMINCSPCLIFAKTWKKFAYTVSGVECAQVLLNKFKKSDFPHIDKAPLVEFWKDGQKISSVSGKQLHLAHLLLEVSNDDKKEEPTAISP